MWKSSIQTFVGFGRQANRRRRSSSSEAEAPSVTITDAPAQQRQRNDADDDSDQSLPLLYALCRRWAWPAVTFRCGTHPMEASASIQDRSGDTVLHWACFGKPPLEPIEALLAICPELASTANKEGMLAIHVAAMNRASSDVIATLMRIFPEGARMPSKTTRSMPLHLMCDYGTTEESIRVVVSTEAGAVSVMELDGTFRRKPLHILNSRKNMREFLNALKTLRQIRESQWELQKESRAGVHHEGVNHDEVISELQKKVEPFHKLGFWKKASLLVQVEYRGQPLDEDFDASRGILHACAGIVRCPPTLLELAMLLHPEQLLEQDENGMVPLHVAVTRPGTSVLSEILRNCPEAARVRDNNHLYPVQAAVDAGRRWGNGVGDILAAYPEAVETLDLDDCLYPMMWLKLSRKGGIDGLFRVILAKPSIISGCTCY